MTRDGVPVWPGRVVRGGKHRTTNNRIGGGVGVGVTEDVKEGGEGGNFRRDE